jgi:hypothetical protein
MVEFECGDCEATLVAVASTVGNAGVAPGRSKKRPYPTVWFTCPGCGAAWEQLSSGALTKRRERLDPS